MYRDRNNAESTEGITSSSNGADLFDQSIAGINDAYVSLGHTLGWRFLTGSKAALTSGADIGFITLNPGGDAESPDHPCGSCEAGNAYFTETWGANDAGKAPLQRQVQMLFTQLAAQLGETTDLREFMAARVLSGYFIPFRSPNIAALPRRRESLEFATSLWTAILDQWTPRCIVTIDTETFRVIGKLLANRPGVEVIESRLFPTGWGEIQAAALRLRRVRKDSPVTIARLPHLSRFQLFGNPVRQQHLDAFITYISKDIPQV
jgi:hypothetical protein